MEQAEHRDAPGGLRASDDTSTAVGAFFFRRDAQGNELWARDDRHPLVLPVLGRDRGGDKALPREART